MKTHHICIIGGSGFVGRHLAARLARDGHRLRVLTRRREPHRDLLILPTLELIECNVHDEEALRQAVNGCDVVINLVGILNEKGHNGKGFHRAHVALTEAVIKACKARGVKRLLHMSALGADVDGPSYYQRTKGEAEQKVLASGLAVTCFRPSVIFGHDDRFFNRFAGLLRLVPLSFPLAGAQARFAPVYVGDVVEAYARAIDNPATIGHSYALCGPRVYTLQALVRFTAQQIGVWRWVFPLPGWAAYLQARMLELVPGKPLSRDNLNSMKRDNVCEDGFPEVFGIQPTSIEAIVPEYLNPRQGRASYTAYRREARR